MKTLIGFNGKKGSGKDTAGEILSQLTNIPTYALANPLKIICSELFGFTDNDIHGTAKETIQEFQLVSWKDKLITLSRDYFGELADEISNDILIDDFYKIVLLPNLRSENEDMQSALVRTSPRNILQLFGTNFARRIDKEVWIKLADKAYEQSGALIITDVRFNNEAKWIKSKNGLIVNLLRDKVENSGDTHSSEAGIDKELIDIKIDNNGPLEELRNSVELLLEYKIAPAVITMNDLL